MFGARRLGCERYLGSGQEGLVGVIWEGEGEVEGATGEHTAAGGVIEDGVVTAGPEVGHWV